MTTHANAPLYSAAEEIAHAVTHGLGLILSAAGLVALVAAATLRGTTWHVVGCAVFGVTLVLLYAASTLYHGVTSPRAKRVLRQVDHAAVFLLIAGTYTPFTLVNLRGSWGFTLLALVWGLAILGVALHVAIPRGARRLSVPLSLAMGWLVVIALEPLVRSVHPEGLLLMVLGGVAYTLGVVFYTWRRLPYNHLIWHLFVMAGSACHFSCVLGYVIPPAA
ncbi:MAG: hemolysin III family protein [Deltaproteobacteria bacterium]|nr:MAG: hemolysin III family protein [Deltaproteobacteria bacterium]